MLSLPPLTLFNTMVYSFFVHTDYLGCARIGDIVLFQKELLFNLAHFLCFYYYSSIVC